ncbi:MAG: aminopeptidase P family protein [Cuneatibacter sp.]|nr:aminopeptidase P family protein [Cuneatibacter sp.]
MIPERLEQLRAEMRARGIDVYLIPTADCHESEYVGEHFKARVFMTGFTGSAGTAVVTLTEAGLWTDGRYFIQAANQLKDTTVTLYRMREEGVPTVEAFLADRLPEGGVLGFDGKVVNAHLGQDLAAIAAEKKGSLYTSEDLVDLIWKDRPALSCEPVWILKEEYAGESRTSKIARVRTFMKENGANTHIITDLADTCWLFNIRGNDALHFPIALSFTILTETEARLYIQQKALSDEVRRELEQDGVTLCEYGDVYEAVKQLPVGTVLLDDRRVNYAIYSSLPEGLQIVSKNNPEQKMKSEKNETELKNLRIAHVKDGVAVTKFMYWLKKNVGKIPMNEVSVSDYLAKLRSEQEDFLDLSFNTIAGYNANAAMMHYSAKPGSAAELKPEGFLLVDSGGHYLQGSTDITRTFVLGPIPEEWKLHYTTVLRSMLNLSAAHFLYGCNGMALDMLSRGPLWEMGLDYKCGTGHGVGYLLNIHEGPNSFRWNNAPTAIEEGTITTDEPGVYVEGSHGIRIENELICKKAEKNEYGQFMEFEMLTYAPIDLDAVEPKYMTDREKKVLNDYHELVYNTIAPYLTEEEREWLKVYTRPVA